MKLLRIGLEFVGILIALWIGIFIGMYLPVKVVHLFTEGLDRPQEQILICIACTLLVVCAVIIYSKFSRKQFVLKAQLIVLAIFMGLVAMFGMLSSLSAVLFGFGIPPTDQKLAAQFHDNRKSFEEFRTMFQQDLKLEYFPEFRSDNRYKDYIPIMKKAGINSVSRSENGIFMHVAGRGFASKGWRVAIVWSDSTPANVIESLDDFWKMKRLHDWRQAYRHIDDRWYLWIKD